MEWLFKIMNNKMTKEDLVKLLVANFKNEKGYVDLSKLDFTNEDIKGVKINLMKVDGDLNQCCQMVSGDLRQGYQMVEGSLFQSNQMVEGYLCQHSNDVRGKLIQDN